MLNLLLPRFERVIFTRYLNNPRHVPTEELLAAAEELGYAHCRVAADPAAAWKAVVAEWETGDLICITGSFFIAAEMRDEIEKK
jgi:dihydrofolate synthase/folylpolyglutamate synthase